MATLPVKTTTSKPLQSLKGVRILSLALNLPGPAALMRARQMGARCVKLEPPAHPSAPKGTPGDPLGLFNRAAYDVLHQGVRVVQADLKTPQGQNTLHRELSKADVLLTSFRPSALQKLGLAWKALHPLYPTLSIIEVVGAPGVRAEEPGHDLTYLAENNLVQGLSLPPTLYADMGGSLMVCESILQARLHQLEKGKGVRSEVALSEAAAYLALPRAWGLTLPGAGLGGGHAGYRIYSCKDGRVAVAALEPHFAARLCSTIGIQGANIMTMFAPKTHMLIASFFLEKTRQQLDQLALEGDIPMLTLAPS